MRRLCLLLASCCLLAGCGTSSGPYTATPQRGFVQSSPPQVQPSGARCWQCGAPAAMQVALDGRPVAFCFSHVPNQPGRTWPARAKTAKKPAPPKQQPVNDGLGVYPEYGSSEAIPWEHPRAPAQQNDPGACMVCGSPATQTMSSAGQTFSYCDLHVPGAGTPVPPGFLDSGGRVLAADPREVRSRPQPKPAPDPKRVGTYDRRPPVRVPAFAYQEPLMPVNPDKVWVNGSNGRRGYWRTKANSTKADNISARGRKR